MAHRFAGHIQVERNCGPERENKIFIDGQEFPFYTGPDGCHVHLERHSRTMTISIYAEHIEVIDHAVPGSPQGLGNDAPVVDAGTKLAFDEGVVA